MSLNAIPILTFHSIDERDSVLSFAPRLFQHGIVTLHALGYRTLTLLDVVDYLRRGADFPERSCVITFDDGYHSVYENAFSVLERYQMTATVFLAVGDGKEDRLPVLNGRVMLSWGEIREMCEHGIAFGAHTLTHPDLTRLTEEKIETEMRESKEIIEQALGTAITSFAYPFGRFDKRSHAFAGEYFTCAVSDRLGLVRARSDPLALERVESYYMRHERFFPLMATHWFDWYILARRAPRNFRRRFLSQ